MVSQYPARTALLVATVVCLSTAWGGEGGDQLDTLIKTKLMTLPGDKTKQQAYPEGVVVAGTLFKNAQRVAVVVATRGKEATTLVFFTHRDGDWREQGREELIVDGKPFAFADEFPFSFDDLNGDGMPELLVTEAVPTAGARQVSVYTYDAVKRVLVAAGHGLTNPRRSGDGVEGRWKTGATTADVGCEQWRWQDGHLLPVVRSLQRSPIDEYLIGDGEPTMRVALTTYNEEGKVAGALMAVGSVASFRNDLPRGEPARPLRVQLDGVSGRTLTFTPKAAALAAAKLSDAWDELVSRAVFTDPAMLGEEVAIAGAKVRLADVATIATTTGGIGPTFRVLHINDALRSSFNEPADPVSLAPMASAGTDWTRSDHVITAYGLGVNAGQSPVIPTGEVLLAVRLPNVSGFKQSSVQNGLKVTALSVDDGKVAIAITADFGRPDASSKDVTRPLVLVSLGVLPPGLNRIQASIKGLPGSAELVAKKPFVVLAPK